jgi:hypothetical protein
VDEVEVRGEEEIDEGAQGFIAIGYADQCE